MPPELKTLVHFFLFTLYLKRPLHTTANVAHILGDLKMGENKKYKKIPNSKNLVFYLGNQKFEKLFCLINNLPQSIISLAFNTVECDKEPFTFHILHQPNVWQHVVWKVRNHRVWFNLIQNWPQKDQSVKMKHYLSVDFRQFGNIVFIIKRYNCV